MVQGVGIGLRRPHYQELLSRDSSVAWLEFVPENFLTTAGFRAHYLERLAERFPLIPHGVALSVGGPDPLDRDYLTRLRSLLRKVKAPYFSDHICFARGLGYDFFDLLPVPFCEEAVTWIARRAREAMDFMERPLLLENITYYAEMPGTALTEGEFLQAVLAESGAGLLLDVNNAYLNAKNHGRDPLQSLLALPLERAGQIHMAGHVQDGNVLLDNHGAPITGPVFDLYEETLARIGDVPTLLEWDTHIPPLDRVLEEVGHIEVSRQRGLARWTRERSTEQQEVSVALPR